MFLKLSYKIYILLISALIFNPKIAIASKTIEVVSDFEMSVWENGISSHLTFYSGSNQSMQIPAKTTAILKFSLPGRNWNNLEYSYLGIYVYGNDTKGDIILKITEADPPIFSEPAKDIWETILVNRPNSWIPLVYKFSWDFVPVGNGDHIWNPDIGSNYSGVIEISISNDTEAPIYIDDVNIVSLEG